MKNLYELLENFILIYLPKERGYSKNTALSYYTSIKQFLKYIVDILHKNQDEITALDFNRTNINSFLNYIENNGKSITTRNQRQAALISFVSYCAIIEPLYQNTLEDVKKIKVKKNVKNKLDFLTIEEYKALISAVNLNSGNGLRHYTIINLLYDTATRVSELINIKVDDLNYGSNNSIKIYGKGKKYRIVYITDNTVNLLNDYMKKYKIESGYLFINNQNKPLSRFGIEYLIKKYYEIACKSTPSLKTKNVTPHTMRHTKACHFLINGTALPVIQKFLGHASVQTTEIYLDLTSKEVIDAVEKASALITEENDRIIEATWKDDKILKALDEIFKQKD